MSIDSREALLSAIEASFPDGLLSRDEGDLVTYGRDWTRAYTPAPLAVARPRSTAEVARLVALCRQHCVPIVPSGGRTGLAGGAVAARGELVVSLERMGRIGEVDVTAMTLEVEAGAVTEKVH
ncbi:MAG TPA: FAD-binding protein, partial [Kofleriaceae bacterium]|nr:FAD-binding protein [Kofleriaceae bacterium]